MNGLNHEPSRLAGCTLQDIEGRPSMVGKVNVLQQASMAAGAKVSCAEM